MSQTAQPDPLKPALEKAQAELAKHLDEACDSQVDADSEVSVDKLRHLEEELLAAARAAEEAAALRRRLDQRAPDRANSANAGGKSPAVASAPAESGGRVREFRDRGGRAWRVWEVRPGVDRPLRDLQRYLGDYVNGWLAFGCLDNELRKRLPHYPTDWLSMTDAQLDALLQKAVDVPPRKQSAGSR